MNKSQMMAVNKFIIECSLRVNALEESVGGLLHKLHNLKTELCQFDEYLRDLPLEEDKYGQGWEVPELR